MGLRETSGPVPEEGPAEPWLFRRGDAYDLLDSLEPQNVDLVLTSLPYWGQRSYGQRHNWGILDDWRRQGGRLEDPPAYDWYRSSGGVLSLEPVPEWYVSNLVEIFEKARRVLRPIGSMWINAGDTYFARWSSIRDGGRQGLGDRPRIRRRTPMGGYRREKQLLLISARLAIAMQSRRWILRNDVIWSKPNVPPRPEADRLCLSHEHFFHFVLSPKAGRARYYYDRSAAEPGARDVVSAPVRAGKDGHSVTFPEDLIRPRILSSCPPGGLVLDLFCSTGRALSVALASGRRGVGFDVAWDGTAGARVASREARRRSPW